MRLDDRFELTVERLAFPGRALGRAPDGRVVFLRAGAPGDRVEVRITRVARRHAEAEVVVRLADGAARRPPFCPLAGTCGGCPWQAVELTVQRAALAREVERALRRAVAGQPGAPPELEPVVPAEPHRAWRSTARLHWSHGRLGYHRAGRVEVIDAPLCPILAPEVARLLVAVRGELLPALRGEGEMRLTAAPGAESGTVDVRPSTPIPELAGALERLVERRAACHGAASPGRVFGTPSNAFGDPPARVPAGGFVQAHRPGNASLVAAVGVALEPLADRRVLELYAGSGNFTLPLAAGGAHVTAVEVDATAALALGEAAIAAGLAPRVDARALDAGAPPRGDFDAVLLDPPRTGAAAAISALHVPRAAALVYVSCDPATLARDARSLVNRGWRLAGARPFELFPHTGHVEILAVFRRDATARRLQTAP